MKLPVTLPLEKAYRAERRAFLATIESLSDDALASAETLCEGWAPRDVLGHLLGIDFELGEYVRSAGRVGRANATIVNRYRRLDLVDLRVLARRWAEDPAVTSLVAAPQLLGDLGVHHQDVLRPLGRTRDVPEATAKAILREGVILGGKRLLEHRVVPTDGGRALGRGREVRGTREALGMWLSGRRGIEPELDFA